MAMTTIVHPSLSTTSFYTSVTFAAMTSLQSSLCGYCQGLDIRQLLLKAGPSLAKRNVDPHGSLHSAKKGVTGQAASTFYKHRPNLCSLKSAADSCTLCSNIWKEYARHRQPIELTEAAISQGAGGEQVYVGTLDWDTAVNTAPHVAVVQLGSPPHNLQRQLACFEVCAESRSIPESPHLLARLQASNAADPQCLELAKDWLEKCCSEHKKCQKVSSQSLRFPTRVLQVGDDALESRVRLVNAAQCDGQYAALSYCWGPDRLLLLTQETEELLREGIPMSDFPRTLKDAITVTQKLGIPYIWIDALCIFQDQERQASKDDWAREAGRMRDVYRGAVLTIEAASATRTSEGFLKARQSSKPYCVLEWNGETRVDRVHLRPIVDITDNQLLGAKIFTRGWTMQERLLAPRTLSFGRQQISYECANGFVDEAGRSTLLPRVTEAYLSKDAMLQLRQDRNLPARLLRSLLRMLSLPPVLTLFETSWFSQGLISLPGGYSATYYHYWRSIIVQFTERQLTNRQDRLPALSGLADEFQRATGDYYIAGMWKEELLFDLAWRCNNIYNPDGEYGNYEGGIPANNFLTGSYPGDLKSTSYSAPSWSWASVQGKVTFFLRTFHITRSIKQYARVMDIHTTPKYPNDPLGSLLTAHIVLKAPFIRIPDPQLKCLEDYTLKTLHSHIRAEHTYKGDNFATEFWQHHTPYQGQQYGLIKLFHENPRPQQTSRLLELLLVESCDGTNGWRRLCGFGVFLTSLQELEDEHFKHLDEGNVRDREHMEHLRPELRKMATIAGEVQGVSWKLERLVLY